MDKLKKTKVIATIGIFLLSFLSHFMYDLFPNTFVSFFFPVNESIFEHMKIIYTSTLLYGIIDYFILKKEKIVFANFPLQLFLTSFLGIVLYLIIYLPIYYFIGEFLPLSIFLLFVVYSRMQIMSYYILKLPNYPVLNKISIVLIIVVYINFIILTYHPPHHMLFYDTRTMSYGIYHHTKG